MNPFEEALKGNFGALDPSQEANIRSGFARRTTLPPDQEGLFRRLVMGRGWNPDDPTYDARAAFLDNRLPVPGQHGLSTYKGLGDERLMLPLGPGGALVDTRTMQAPDPQLVNLWRVISGVMNK